MKACLLPEERICTDVDNNRGFVCTQNQIRSSYDLFYDRITLRFLIKSDVSACFEMKGMSGTSQCFVSCYKRGTMVISSLFTGYVWAYTAVKNVLFLLFSCGDCHFGDVWLYY